MAIRFSQALDLDQNKIGNVADPSMIGDVATKGYVDALAVGLSWRPPVRVAATGNIDLVTPGAVDGVTLVDGDRVLLRDQTDDTENGLYVASGGSLIRAEDTLQPGTAVQVNEGATFHDQAFVMTADAPFTTGSSAQTWTVFNAGGVPVYTEGDGIDVTGYRISAVATANGGIAVGPSGIAVVADPNGALSVGAAGVAVTVAADRGLSVGAGGLDTVLDPDGGLTVGAAGTAVVADPSGGLSVSSTGVAVLADPDGALTTTATGTAVVADPTGGLSVSSTGVAVLADPAGGLSVGASGVAAVTDGSAGVPSGVTLLRKFTAVVGDGSATTINVSHGLGTRAVTVELIANSAPYDTVTPEVHRPDINHVDLLFGSAPSSGEYTVVIGG